MATKINKIRMFSALILGLGVMVGLCWGISLGFKRSATSGTRLPPGAFSSGSRSLQPAISEALLCGPRSMTGAAARLGVWIEPKAFAARCQVTERGISMLALKEAAPIFGLEADGMRLNWAQLAALDRPAVIFLTPDHYAFVDPREKPPTGQEGQLRLYDDPKPARWIARDELLKQWGGEALVVGRDAEARQGLAFETLLEDFGSAYAKDTPACTFHFRNAGSEAIKILEVKKSCGCAKADLSQSELRPGETARLTVAIDLKGRRGVQRQVVYLRTSSPAQPIIPVTLQGAALNPVHVSTDAIDLGLVLSGQRVDYDFVVTDRNTGSLQLTTCTFAAESKDATPAAVDVAARWETTDRTDDELLGERAGASGWTTIIRGKGAGHYRVRLTARVSPVAPPGLHQGLVTLTTNDPQSPTITLPLLCQVASAHPTAAAPVSFGIVRPNQVVTRRIPFDALAEGDLDALRGEFIVAEGAGALKPQVTVRRESGPTGGIELELDLRGAPEALKPGLHQGAITLKTPKTILRIPWMCLAKRT